MWQCKRWSQGIKFCDDADHFKVQAFNPSLGNLSGRGADDRTEANIPTLASCRKYIVSNAFFHSPKGSRLISHSLSLDTPKVSIRGG
jgi:hypothetical protein